MKLINRLHLNSYILPFCVAGFLGVYRLGSKSLWLDEVLTIRIAAQDWGAMWFTLTSTEPYRWLYYVLLHVWMRFGSGDAYYRLLSVVIGLTSIPGIYVLGKSVGSQRTGAISAFLLAIHPMFQRYLQDVHSYSLVVSLSIWSSYLFVLFMHRPTVRRMAAYVLSALFMVYSHSFGIFVLASHYVSLLYLRRFAGASRLYSISIITLILGLAPFLLFPIPNQNIAWIHYPSRAEIMNFILLLSGGHILLFLGLTGLFVYSWHSVRTEESMCGKKDGIFLMTWLLFPVISVFTVSYLLRPIFVPRYMIIVLPALLVLVGDGLARLSNMKMYVVLVGLAGIMAVSNLYWHTGLPVYARLGFVTFADQEDWKGVSEYIRDHGDPNDSIIFYPYFIRYPFEYYWKQFDQNTTAKIEEISSASYTIGGVMPEPNMKRIQDRAKSGRTWLVLSHNLNSSLGRDRQTEEIKKRLDLSYANKEEMYRTGVTIVLYYESGKK